MRDHPKKRGLSTHSIRVILADDHPLIIQGISHELRKTKQFDILDRVNNSTELMKSLSHHACDVLVSDYMMPGGKYGDGIPMFSLIRRHYPDLRLVALTVLDNPTLIRELMRLGIACIVNKCDTVGLVNEAILAAWYNQSYLSPAIKDVLIRSAALANRTLSPREAEFLRLFTAGLTVTEIARQWERSVQSVSAQKRSAMRKLGVSRNSDLLRYIGASTAPSPDSPA